MKIHYFNQEKPDSDDFMLKMAIQQGYVPESCLLGGSTVMSLVVSGQNPCDGCKCNREKCKGHKINNLDLWRN